MGWRRLASNAVANLAIGLSALLAQLVITGIVARHTQPSSFSIWAIAFSVAAAASVFGLNLSTVVARLSKTLPAESRPAALAEARQWSRRLSCLAMGSLCLIGWALARLSPTLQGVPDGWWVPLVAWLVAAQLWQVHWQPPFGLAVADGRFWSMAKVHLAARLLGCLMVAWGAFAWPWVRPWLPSSWTQVDAVLPQLGFLALSLGLGSWLGAWLAGFIGSPHKLSAEPAPVDPVPQAQLAALSASRAPWVSPLLKGFAVWALGTAAVQYALTPFISLIESARLNAFFLAQSLNVVAAGVVGAAGSALVTPLLNRHAQGQRDELARVLARLPALAAVFTALGLAILMIVLDPLLRWWTGTLAPVSEVRAFLVWLGLQTILRSTAMAPAAYVAVAGSAQAVSRATWVEMGLMVAVAAPLGLWRGSECFLIATALAGAVASGVMMQTALATLAAPPALRRALRLKFFLLQGVALITWLGLFGPSWTH